MDAGIPVINVDREFDSPFAARATVLGDNYGMGVSAGTYICDAAGRQARRGGRRDRRHRLAAADPGPQPGLRRRARRLRPQGRATASPRTSPSRAARRRRPTCCRPRRRSTPSGTTTTTRASASWRPSSNAGRDEFFMVGGAGSANAMRSHPGRRLGAQGDGHLPVDPGRRRHQAGPPARPGQGDVATWSRSRCPAQIMLYAPVVTKDNVDQYIDSAFES